MSAISMMKIVIALLLITALLPSCGRKGPIVGSGQEDLPRWIYHYEAGSKTCGIGNSLPHIKGLAYQRAVAVSRGIDEIARQMNVIVNTEVERYMTATNGSASSSISSFSVQTTTGVSVSAKIIDAWMSRQGGQFYVLLCTD